MNANEVPGQLSLLSLVPDNGPGPAHDPTAQAPTKKPSPRVTWVGAGCCRSCGTGLYVYRKARRFWAWVQPDLVRHCPGCGLAITTTTFELTGAA